MRRWICWLIAAVIVLVSATVVALSMRDVTDRQPGLDSASLGMLLLDAEDGVYVLAVSDRSPADLAGLQPGDCILFAGNSPLADSAALNELLQTGGERLTLTVLREERRLRLILPCR